MRIAGLVRFRIDVRAADAAPLQTILGFWPALLTGFALRAYGVLHFPFLDEEVTIIRNGVDSLFGLGPQSGQAPFWDNLLFRTPLTNSKAITPLWWWTEFAARLILRDDTLAARLFAFLCGLAGLALFFRLARRLLPPPAPGLLAWLLAVHDALYWVSVKAQYVESLIFAASIILAWALLASPGGRRPFLAACQAAVVAMGFFLVKGFTLAVSALAVAAALAILHHRLDVGLLLRRALIAGLLLLPIVAWLAAAQAYVTARYQLRGEEGYFQRISQLIYEQTLGYGKGKRAGPVGPPYFALQLYSNGDAWPTSTALAPLVAAGFVLAIRTVLGITRAWPGGEAARQTPDPRDLALYIVIVTGLTLGPLVAKGTIGSRFHVLYLVAALLAVGLTLERCWQARDGRWGWLIAGAGVYAGAMLSWADWTAGSWRPGWPFVWAATAGLACGGAYTLARSDGLRRALLVAGVGLVVALSLVRGPFQWGRYAPFEPEPRSPVLAQLEQTYHGGIP